MNHAEITSLGESHIVIRAPYCTLHLPKLSFADHVSMRSGALAEILRLMSADDPGNCMTSLSARLADELRGAYRDIQNALLLTKQIVEILRNEQTDEGPGDLLWLCQQIADELCSVLGAMMDGSRP